jgi:hypothetical protein
MSLLIRQMSDTPAPPSSIVPLPLGAIDDDGAVADGQGPGHRPPSLRAAVLASSRGRARRHRGESQRQLGRAERTATARSAPSRTTPRRHTRATWPPRAAPRSRGADRVVAALAIAAGVAETAITIQLRSAGDPPPEPPRAVGLVVRSRRSPHRWWPRGGRCPGPGTVTIITVAGVPPNTEVIVAGPPRRVAPGPVQSAARQHPVVLTSRSTATTRVEDAHARPRSGARPPPRARPCRRPGGGRAASDIIDDRSTTRGAMTDRLLVFRGRLDLGLIPRAPTSTICPRRVRQRVVEAGEDCDAHHPSCVPLRGPRAPRRPSARTPTTVRRRPAVPRPGGALAQPTAPVTFPADDLRVTEVDHDGRAT